MTIHTLTVTGEALYFGDSLLLVRYDAGDCDTITWPFEALDEQRHRERLHAALYDETQCNCELKDGDVVCLPDGEQFGRVEGIHFIMGPV